MSRIGKIPLTIPKDVKVDLSPDQIKITGPKGELTQPLPRPIKVNLKDQQLVVSRQDDSRQAKALHGLTRSLIANMLTGVTQGFEKKLELVGTGYRVKKEGDQLTLTVGFSHPVEIKSPSGINLEVVGNNQIIVKGINKQQVGQTAAMIRAIKKPEPYKGKGIKYHDEVVRRKPGKAAKVGIGGPGAGGES
jgi:large subunit ribosomal protein L6